jgi:glycerol-3-phosphate dehydrogenase
MKRDLRALAERPWDVAVVGGGIHGACVAWDAVLRGLTVCLVDRADFAAATSANTMKIIHGGLRYLQHADVRRMRESVAEQRSLLRIAPHLVHPLPVLVPTYGHAWRGRAALRVALRLNDLIRRGHGDGQRLPRSRTVSRRECLGLTPGLDTAEVTGAGVFYDAQVRNSERLVLAFLRSAAKAGAELANYAEVTELRRDADGLVCAIVSDRLGHAATAIRARTVVNASGPWVDQVRGRAPAGPSRGASFAKAFNVVTRQLLPPGPALALPLRHAAGAAERARRRGTRSLFVVPWREQSLVGTWYTRHDGAPGDVRITEADVTRLLEAINQACPALAVTLDDVRLVHGGLLPLTGIEDGLPEAQLARHGRIVDHAHDGFPGLISIVGVKYTTARLMAERAVDRVFERLGRTPPPSMSARVSLHGGEREMAEAAAVLQPARAPLPPALDDYGSARGEVLAHLRPGEQVDDPIAILRAEVRHAIRAEMALTLSDVVFRRTGLASAGDPGIGLLAAAARAAGIELGWSTDREKAELRQVYGRFGVPR